MHFRQVGPGNFSFCGREEEMRKVLFYVALFAAVVVVCTAALAQSSGLWTGTPYNFPIASTVTSATGAGCTPPTAGTTNYCRTGTGEQISCNGAAYIPGDQCTPAATALKTVNGVAPGATGNVTVACADTGATPATTASLSGALATGITATVPAMNVAISTKCPATGS
jgi:hypothetical protein